MKPALILVAIMVVAGAVLYVLDRIDRRRSARAQAAGTAASAKARAAVGKSKTAANATAKAAGGKAGGCQATGCALSSVCSSEVMMKGCASEAEYYDDEELDAFKGRGESSYTASEEDQFRDVLYTLLPADRMGWAQSLRKRGIAMPRAVYGEFVSLASGKH